MKVRVWYTTQLKAALGRASESVEVEPPATLGKLLEQLAQQYGAAFQDLVLDASGQLRPSILLCIGDAQADADPGVALGEGDEVTIVSAISGG